MHRSLWMIRIHCRGSLWHDTQHLPLEHLTGKSPKESAFERYQDGKIGTIIIKGCFCSGPLWNSLVSDRNTDNKKWFYKYINNKRRAEENFHPFLDIVGNTVTKDEENPEGLGNSSPLFHFATLSPSGIELLLAEITTFSTVNITHSLPLSIMAVSLLNLYLSLLFRSCIMPN